MNDIEEIKIIINNLQHTEELLQRALVNWKKNIKNCQNINIFPGKKIIENLCNHPNSVYLNKEFFEKLYTFLNVYIAIREKKLAYTGKSLDNFLKIGLNSIYKYVIVSEYFTNNIKYIVPDNTDNTDKFRKIVKTQNVYKDYLLTLSENLIGCKKRLFMFLPLIDSIKNLNDDQKKQKRYLSDKCLNIRTDKLKL